MVPRGGCDMAVIDRQVLHPKLRHRAVGAGKYDSSTSAQNGSDVRLLPILAQLLYSPLDAAQGSRGPGRDAGCATGIVRKGRFL
jgi:hypothetical protein